MYKCGYHPVTDSVDKNNNSDNNNNNKNSGSLEWEKD